MFGKLKIGLREQNFFFKALFFTNFDRHKKCLNEREDKNENFAVDSAIQLLTKSILRPMVFRETTRQRKS